jgi:hypothetical protein
MQQLNAVEPMDWALIILISSTVFTVLWSLDALTHKKIAHIDLTDKELQTHRNILLASVLMEASLVGMFWLPGLMLPLFVAFFITRTAHEFIDELHYHTGRCTPYETYLHLGMWVTVLTKTFAMFIWGFFYQFKGIEDLSWTLYCWAAIVFLSMNLISYFEWKR